VTAAISSQPAAILGAEVHGSPVSIDNTGTSASSPDIDSESSGMPRDDSYNSFDSISEERKHSSLAIADESVSHCSLMRLTDRQFNDEDGSTIDAFVAGLQYLSPSNSTTDLCIQKAIVQGEKAHFKERHRQKLNTIVTESESEMIRRLTAF
jgi:hypothetical protein